MPPEIWLRMPDVPLPLHHRCIVFTEHLTIFPGISANLHSNTISRKEIQPQSQISFRQVAWDPNCCLVPIIVTRFIKTRRVFDLPLNNNTLS